MATADKIAQRQGKIITGNAPYWWGAAGFRLGQAKPSLILDIKNSLYSINDRSASISELISFVATGGGTYLDDDGFYKIAAENAPRMDYSSGHRMLLLEGQRTNKVASPKHNPTGTTGLTLGGDVAATLTVVDDATELAAAGLSQICSNSKVWKFDNSGASDWAWIFFDGTTGNTNAHSFGCYIRGDAGYLQYWDGGSAVNFGASAGYVLVKNENVSPSGSAVQLSLVLAAGDVVYFILPQLVEEATIGRIIPGTAAAAETIYADYCGFTAEAISIINVASAAIAWRGNVAKSVASQDILGFNSGSMLENSGALRLDMSSSGYLDDGNSVIPGNLYFAFAFGPSGLKASVNGNAAVSNAYVADNFRNGVYIGPSTGLAVGQSMSIDQVIFWPGLDLPSTSDLVAQSKAA